MTKEDSLDPMTLAASVEKLSHTRVLCIGDMMLDRFIHGDVERISPEAPIPVFDIKREETMLGGAGNVVRNLVELGAEACFITVVGDDEAGNTLTQMVGRVDGLEPYLLVERGRASTVKTRYVAGSQQMLRADRERRDALTPASREEMMRLVSACIGEVAAVVLSDYGKGVICTETAPAIIEEARRAGRPVVVDPKGRDYGRYRGATVITPNRRELAEATGMPVDNDAAITAAARRLIEQTDVEAILVTRSGDGMTLVTRNGDAHHLRARAREVYDVSGAGDTVIATFAAAFAQGMPMLQAAQLANAAAGVVVGKVGTATVGPHELTAALQEQELAGDEGKVLALDHAQERVARWRRAGKKVVFTNGCFDLLHPGHIALLDQARAAGDRLVVGLNSDASVKRLKGDDRPVQPASARALVLASLESVDMVVIFEEDTPLRLLETLKPDVLVKGADYTVETVVGADLVQGYGGKVVLADLKPGFSTTSTIARLRR